MLHKLILKVTKFQLCPPKGLGTVVSDIFGGHHAPPMLNRVKEEEGLDLMQTFWYLQANYKVTPLIVTNEKGSG